MAAPANNNNNPDINVTLLGWVQAANGANFRKVCIVHNKTYQVLAKTHVEHVPTQWKNENGDQINENQELLDDWKAKKSLNFFQTTWTVKMKDEKDGKFLVGEEEGKNVIVAREFDIYWFIASGPINSAKQDKGFDDYKKAYEAIMTIWEPIMEQQQN